jgi:hypothetical protein
MPSRTLYKRLEKLEAKQRARQRYRAPPALPPIRPQALGEALRELIDRSVAIEMAGDSLLAALAGEDNEDEYGRDEKNGAPGEVAGRSG